MIIIHSAKLESAERMVKATDRYIRSRWNVYGLRRFDSGKTADGFAIIVEIPEIWNFWTRKQVTEREVMSWIKWDEDTLDVFVH